MQVWSRGRSRSGQRKSWSFCEVRFGSGVDPGVEASGFARGSLVRGCDGS